MRFVASMIGPILLTGCVVMKWEQEGKPLAEVERDHYACEQKFLDEYPFLPIEDRDKDKFMEQCMRDKGYRRSPK